MGGNVISPALGALLIDVIIDKLPFLACFGKLIALLKGSSVYSERLYRGSRLARVERSVEDLLPAELASADHCLYFTCTYTDYGHGSLRLTLSRRKGVGLAREHHVIAVYLYCSFVVRVFKEVLAYDDIAFGIGLFVAHRDVEVSARDGIADVIFVIEEVCLEFKTVIGLAIDFGLIDVELVALHDGYAAIIIDLHISVSSAQPEVAFFVKVV